MTDNIPTISASKLKTYKVCGRKYQLRYLLDTRPEEYKNVAALLGTALHKALETIYTTHATESHTQKTKQGTSIFQQVMFETLAAWEEAKYTIVAADYFTRALKVGKDILTTYPWDLWNDYIGVEQSFTLPFYLSSHAQIPYVYITGVMDLVTPTHVIDHKSTVSAPTMDELAHDPQLLLYYWAYTQLYHKEPTIIWNHLRTNTQYTAHIIDNYDEKMRQLQYDIEAMVHTQWFPRILLSDTCKTRCSFFTTCYSRTEQ